VAQDDWTTPGTYCASKGGNTEWWGNITFPNAAWVPPVDNAADVLLVGRINNRGRLRHDRVSMDHALNGCASYVEQFGNNRTMILAQGNRNHAGYQYLLKWDIPSSEVF